MHPLQREIQIAKQQYREGWGEDPVRIFIPANRLDDLKSVDNRAIRRSVDHGHVYIEGMRLCVGGDKVQARARELPNFDYMDTHTNGR